MRELSKALPDQELGLRLQGDDVERLRMAVGWARQRRGLRLKDIARACDVPEHTLRNFVHRKSLRPANALLGRIYRYFRSKPALGKGIPELADLGFEESETESRIGILARYGLVRLDVPITEDDIRRVYERYSGYYVCFSRSARPTEFVTSWLHVRPLRPGSSTDKRDLPLCRFTLLLVVPDVVDPGRSRRYVVVGYVITRNGRLFFIGHHDGELQFLALNEPRSRRFDYLQGISSLTVAAGRVLVSGQVVCQHLGSAVDRNAWNHRIGVFDEARFRETFDNADAIADALALGNIVVV